MEILYSLLVYPIETLLRWVLIHSESLSGSFGLALIVLSVVFNLILLPFYHVAEKVRDKERVIQRKMAPKIQEFREVFGGQERYLYLRTLYRQHHYHPIFALRGLLPLVIQIPVFAGAYFLLSDFEPIKGVPFLFISDLGEADQLLGGFNLLPFVMTAVNLFAGMLYTKNLAQTEKVQIWAVAALFLVLLYESPSALVFYWTFNNFFSLAKNVIYSHTKATRFRMELRNES